MGPRQHQDRNGQHGHPWIAPRSQYSLGLMTTKTTGVVRAPNTTGQKKTLAGHLLTSNGQQNHNQGKQR
jgi:hypothetical protein